MIPPEILDVLIPLAFVAAGLLLGLFLEKVVLRQLQALALVTRWPTDNVIFASFKGIPLFWGAALGLYGALQFATSDPDTEAYLRSALLVAIVWSLTIVAARTGAGLVTSYAGRTGTLLPSTSIIPNLVRLTLYALGLLIVLNALGIPITPILTALGVGGLAVALALQDTLANVFAGLYLLAARQIKPGHFIRLEGGDEGYVHDITWRSTAVRTIYDNLIIIPNAKLASAVVTNYSLPQEHLLLRIAVGVDYDSDLDRVERLTAEVAREAVEEATRRKLDEEPRTYYQSFGEFSLNLVVFVRVRDYFEQYRVRHLFMKKLIARFRAEGIKLPFPIREFQMQVSPEGPEAGGSARVYPPDLQASAAESGAAEPRERP